VEKKLSFQELLPDLKFRYNLLGKGYNLMKGGPAPLFENNFQYGISVGIPLRFSTGRGAYRRARININVTGLQLDLKINEITNRVRQRYNEMRAYESQAILQQRALENFTRLQQGEETRFAAGESSLFLVNIRENKRLEALQKSLEFQAKYIISGYEVQEATGILAR